MGEQRRMEAGNVFGEGSRTPVAVTLLIKNPKHKGEIEVNYFDIGDYLSREEKLRFMSNTNSIDELEWTRLLPNTHGDWINQRDEKYSTFIPLSDKDNKGRESQAIFKMFSTGIQTGRDTWSYSFSKDTLAENAKRMVVNYNNFLSDFRDSRKTMSEITRASKKEMSWSRSLLDNLQRGKSAEFNDDEVVPAIYRPFQKMWLYQEKFFVEQRYQSHVLFPNHLSNLAIHTTGPGASVDFGALVINSIPNKLFMDNGQCFPMFYYPQSPQKNSENLLFATDESDSQLHAVSDWALNEFRVRYSKKITKEEIFYYVYGVLSAPEYKKRFKNELKKQTPRVPFLNDFAAYREFGRELADLHLNYETIENTFCKVDIVNTAKDESELYKVEKMRFGKDGDKTSLVYNQYITIRNIPEDVFQYIINGKSPIDWVIDRYILKNDVDSDITNDPNKYSDDPKYIFNLLLSVISMTKTILELQETLPKLVIPES